MNKVLIYIFTLLVLSSGVTGQTPEKKQYKATKLITPPVINGMLDDEAWKGGTWVDDFTQNEPYNGRQASQRTEFKILFDDNNIYAAFKAYDTSPDSIVNRLTRRDNQDGDLVGIILDSFHDLRTGFLFGISSSGVKYDQMFTNDGENEDPSWDPNWWVKTSVNSEGWIAEMKIPFSEVRFEKNSGDTWGLEVARLLYRKHETSFWQHIPKDAPGFVHMFGELSGFEQIRPRKIFDITPYTVGKLETFKPEPGNPFLEKGRGRGLNAGIDAKIGLTNNITMDLTINPDFGQVEADPSEINLSAYETFFKEKRPFFIEGNNITNFNIGIGDGDVGNDNLFYSRRIGREPHQDPDLGEGSHASVPINTTILSAAKITGKTQNGLSVGFLEAVTAEEKAETDKGGKRSSETVEPLTNYFVGRVQKDFNDGKTIIGGIITGTNRSLDVNLADYLHKAAYSGGIDFAQYFRDKNWMFSFNASFSQVSGTKKAIEITQMSSAHYFQRPDKDYAILDPDRTSLTGSGGRMMISKLNGHLNLGGVLLWKSPGFELNDMGYLREADQLMPVVWAGYNLWEPKGIYRNLNINADIYSLYNFGGDNVTRGIECYVKMTLKNFWEVWTGGNLGSKNALDASLLRGGPTFKTPGRISGRIGFTTDNRKKLGFELLTNYDRRFENYYKNSCTTISLSYKPTNYFSVSFGPGYSESSRELQYITTLKYNNSDRYILASIDQKTISASLRINFNMSPDLTLQYWGQPFIATGKYHDYKFVTDPMGDNYRNRFHTFTTDQFHTYVDGYSFDENLDGIVDYNIDKSDFNLKEFLSNLVIRWEYNPGSTVYFVWCQTRRGSNDKGNLDYFNDMSDMFNRSDNDEIRNVFLVKLSYRFGLKQIL